MENPSTKQRLLEAAVDLFAERGFEGVSIRDLAAAAEVNIAAVNYHFQGKENLYREALKHCLCDKRERAVESIQEIVDAAEDGPELGALIRAFVTQYLEDALRHPKGPARLHLMVRSLHDMQHGGDLFFKELAQPVHAAFTGALARACPDLSSADRHWIFASLIGQVIHFILRWQRAAAVTEDEQNCPGPWELLPALRSPLDEYIQQVVDHVTHFSLAGAEGLARQTTRR